MARKLAFAGLLSLSIALFSGPASAQEQKQPTDQKSKDTVSPKPEKPATKTPDPDKKESKKPVKNTAPAGNTGSPAPQQEQPKQATATPATTDSEKKAPDEKDGKKTYRLKPTVISAIRVPEEASDLPQSTSVASRKEIERRAPIQPIEAIQDEPGVFVQQTGAGGGTPIVRGLIGNRVLYVIDGIRINNGRIFGGPNPFFNQVDIGSLEQIEVLRGPGAVQYGSDAMGGVFHFRTKTLDLFPKELTFGGSLLSQYRSVDRSMLGHLELFAADEHYNVMIGGTAVNAENYQGGDSHGTIDFTSYKTRSAFGKFRLKIDEGHVLTVAYLDNLRTDVFRHDQSARNQPSGIPRFTSPREQRRIIYVRDSIENAAGWLSKLEPYAYHQGVVRESTFTVESTTQLRTDNRASREKTYGFGALATTDINDDVRIIYGFDMRFEEFNDRSTRYTTDKTTGTVTSAERAASQPDGRYDVEDVYAFVDWQPLENLRITAGGRFESAHINSSPEPLDVSSGFTEKDLDLDERYNSITWSLGAMYWATENLAFTATAATGFRAPTYSDTLSRGAFTFGVNTPSPSVDPEESFSYDIGLRYESDTVSGFVTWYQTFVRDQLVGVATGGFVDLDGNGTQDAGEAAFQRRNKGSSRIYGIEAGGSLFALSMAEFFSATEVDVLDNFELFGSLSWTYGEDLEGSQPQRFIPPMNGVLGLRISSDKKPGQYFGWEFSVFARMVRHHSRVSSSDMTDPGRAQTPSQTFPSATNPPLRSDFSIPGYTTLHCRLNLSLTKNTRIFFAGDNLTNKKYRAAYSRQDAPGISFTIGAEVKF